MPEKNASLETRFFGQAGQIGQDPSWVWESSSMTKIIFGQEAFWSIWSSNGILPKRSRRSLEIREPDLGEMW